MAPPTQIASLARRQVYTFTATVFPVPTVTVINAVTTTITPAPTTTVFVTNNPDPYDNNDSIAVVDGNSRDGGLSAGAIVGIVLGSIVGLLLLIWIIRSCTNGFGSRSPKEKDIWVDDRYAGSRGRSRSTHSRRSHHVHGHSHHHHSRNSRRQSARPHRTSRSTVRTVRTVGPAYLYDADVGRPDRSRSRAR